MLRDQGVELGRDLVLAAAIQVGLEAVLQTAARRSASSRAAIGAIPGRSARSERAGPRQRASAAVSSDEDFSADPVDRLGHASLRALLEPVEVQIATRNDDRVAAPTGGDRFLAERLA